MGDQNSALRAFFVNLVVYKTSWCRWFTKQMISLRYASYLVRSHFYQIYSNPKLLSSDLINVDDSIIINIYPSQIQCAITEDSIDVTLALQQLLPSKITWIGKSIIDALKSIHNVHIEYITVMVFEDFSIKQIEINKDTAVKSLCN